MMKKLIRSATPEDLNFLYEGLIADFADQGLAHMFKHTKESLHDALFGENPAAKVAIAMSDEMPAGFAIYAIDRRGFAALYSPTLFLHDLYVAPNMRRMGFASFLIDHLKTYAKANGCGRMDWSVLKDNDEAMAFYLSLEGAKVRDILAHMRIEFTA